MKSSKRKFIVFEGLDVAGKTTTIKEILNQQPRREQRGMVFCNQKDKKYMYSKGLGSDTFIGRIALRKPSTLKFMIELLYLTQTQIKPALRQGKTVLQDRYCFSIKSYVPDAEQLHNKFFIKLANNFLLKPDLLLYFIVSKEERIKRLKKDVNNKYHLYLINNPEKILIREKKYLELYNSFKGEKCIIDTTNRSIDDVVEEVLNRIN